MKLAALLALALAAPPVAPVNTDQAIQRTQAFYVKAQDLSASFVQTYKNQAFHQTLTSDGRLVWKKPGMIRFDYEKPEAKFFVVKHDRIVSYSPGAQQAVTGAFHADKLSASVSFLFGKGDLATEFNVKKADRADLSPGVALLLTPKKEDPRFERLYLVLDAQSYEVRESIVVDGSGNENRFVFSDVKVNTAVPDTAFDYKLPEGTQVLKMDVN
jgi:outer membrane lipoprotein carrier protein